MAAAQRDPDDVRRVLEAWLLRVVDTDAVDISGVTIPAGTGFSNETILFDATWADGGTRVRRELVARVAPSSHQVFPDDTFALQFHVMRALAPTAVPTATVHWYEEDDAWFGRPFWIMERVDGVIPTDNPPYAGVGWLADASPAQQARAWWSGIEAIAAVNTVALDGLGTAVNHLRVPGEADGTLAELERYDRFLHWAEGGEPHALARDAIAWLQRNQPPAPAAGPALVWGDSRLSNLVYRDFEVVAVLDWEMATIADPLLDLGWWLFADETLSRGAGFERLPGFGARDETAARWAELTGRATDTLDYFLVFAGMRFTVIMLRIGKLLADVGFPPSFAYDNLVSQGLARQLARV
jgi:aminoglycoside phosphotransferase (APT) family kinase protein